MPVEAGRRAAARRRSVVLAAALWCSALAGLAQAADTPSAARLAACAACHGASGNSPSPAVPSIAGQPSLFIENQLVVMREGLREVPVMKAVLEGISDAEVVALARHYAALPSLPAPALLQPDKLRAGAVLSKQALCGTCHLPDYRGQNQVPRLAGQHEAYLLLSMKQFRDHPGPGRDTLMTSALRGFSDDDLGRLAHYLSHARP